MRYIVNTANYVLAISFGSTIHYADNDCTEYTGSVPSGWDSLEDWYEDEGDKLWRWKIVSGNLTMDSSAVAPADGQWGSTQWLFRDANSGQSFSTVTGSQLIVTTETGLDKPPTAIVVECVKEAPDLSANQISAGVFYLTDGVVSSVHVFTVSALGDGTLNETTYEKIWSVDVYDGYISINVSLEYAFYYAADDYGSYRCHLMYG